MPVFEYKGLDAGGKAVAGIVDADNPKGARKRLRGQGVFPTEIHAQAKGATRGSGLNQEIDLSKYLERVTTRDVAIATRQLAVLVGASVPMAEALTALIDQAEKNKLKVALSEIKEKVSQGSTLADAMKAHPAIFDDLYVQMIRAGEQAGALDVVLKRLSVFAEGSVELQGKVFGAMAYPVLMVFVGIGMLFGIFWSVVPQMRSVFASFGGEDQLPLITKAVFFFGDVLTSWWAVVPLVLGVGLIVAFFAWKRSEKGALRWDLIKLRAPIFGALNRRIAVSRFCRTLSTLLSSGVPIVAALNITKDVVGNLVLSEAIEKAAVNITKGQSIAGPLKASGHFPPLVTHMIAIGERTNEMEAMLTNVADAYDSEVEAAIAAMTTMLGPAMIMVLGAIIGTVAIGLLLPMANISSMMNNF
ncbi:MAG: type II secretion system F family protein [Proteobacteria bacterium]|nr:type II secretion system F family protein [Pseudomonadota bacterium]